MNDREAKDARPYSAEEWEGARLNVGATGLMWQRAVATVDALRADLASIKEMHARILGWPPQDVVNADATLSMAAATMARRDHGSGKALLGALDSIKRHRKQQAAEIDALRADRDEAVALLRELRQFVAHRCDECRLLDIDYDDVAALRLLDAYLGRPR